MHSKRLMGQLFMACALAVAAPSWAQAPMPATAASGIQYVSGGVGADERSEMQAQKAQYSFSLTTAVKGSGEYLSGVRVRILDARSRKVLLDQALDGPWLFAALAPGQYEVEASYSHAGAAQQVQRNIINVRQGAHRQLVFYFNGSAAKMGNMGKKG